MGLGSAPGHGTPDGQTDRIPIANIRALSSTSGTAVARKNQPERILIITLARGV